MPYNFTAFDFETAQSSRWSICQIGLIRVENGSITNKVNLLIQPPNNSYWDRLTTKHGITPAMTKNAPTFNQVWPSIKNYIQHQWVVAHNAAFDCSCLNQTLEYYQLPKPSFDSHCTYKIYGSKLSSLCTLYNIPLNHHDALSDALACAHLFIRHLSKGKARL